MAEPLLKCRGIYKEFGEEIKFTVLHGIDLEIEAEEFISLVGPSGCGKSTFLNILGTLERPTKGQMWVRGEEIFKMREKEVAKFRNAYIGFIFQFHYLLPEFTVMENILMPTWIKTGKADLRAKQEAIKMLELVGIEDKKNNKANELSGGQQQRVAIARSLINKPQIVFADEPTGNLDSKSTAQVYCLLREINKELGTTFLIVTHDKEIAQKSDRIIEMLDGRIDQDYLSPEQEKKFLTEVCTMKAELPS